MPTYKKADNKKRPTYKKEGKWVGFFDDERWVCSFIVNSYFRRKSSIPAIVNRWSWVHLILCPWKDCGPFNTHLFSFIPRYVRYLSELIELKTVFQTRQDTRVNPPTKLKCSSWMVNKIPLRPDTKPLIPTVQSYFTDDTVFIKIMHAIIYPIQYSSIDVTMHQWHF